MGLEARCGPQACEIGAADQSCDSSAYTSVHPPSSVLNSTDKEVSPTGNRIAAEKAAANGSDGEPDAAEMSSIAKAVEAREGAAAVSDDEEDD